MIHNNGFTYLFRVCGLALPSNPTQLFVFLTVSQEMQGVDLPDQPQMSLSAIGASTIVTDVGDLG